MADWPKRLEGHFVDRELVSMPSGVDYQYHCIKCGLHLDDVDESTLELRPCDTFAQRVVGR